MLRTPSKFRSKHRNAARTVLILGFGLASVACSSSGGGDSPPPSMPPPVSNSAPSFGGDRGVTIDENQTEVATVTASDSDGDILTYSISGDDAGLFSIDASTGSITFIVAPDFEAPNDTGRDNEYELNVTASDDFGGSDTILFTARVTNLAETRYLEQLFEATEVTGDIVYASVDGQDLVLNVVTPKGDTETNRPFMLFATGGAFAFTDRTLSLPFAEGYARAGYVTAVMDYRTAGERLEGQAFQNAAVDGTHDMLAAVRYMRANAAAFGIDPDMFIVGGTSAGGFMSATAASRDPGDPVTAGLQDYYDSVGGVYGTVGDHLDQSSAVQGALPISGGIYGLDTLDLDSAPMYGVHNELDSVAPCYTVVSTDGERTISGTCDFIPAMQVLGLPADSFIVPGDTEHVDFTDAEWAQIRDEALAFFYENVINAD